MKKILAFLAPLVLLTALAGCSEIGENAPLLPQDDNTVSAARSIEEADEIALRAFEAFHPNGQGHESRAALSLAHTVITSHASRSNNPDTIFHIVDYGDDLGFAVIGGPKHSEPLYAFVENGSFNDPEVANVEGFQYFMECAADQIVIPQPEIADSMKVGGGGDSAELKTKTEYRWNFVKKGGHEIGLAWGQGGYRRGGVYEGLYCPNKTAGCVMTASLMIMAHFSKPTYMRFTFPERDRESSDLNWMAMKSHFVSHDRTLEKYDENGMEVDVGGTCLATTDQHRDLGRICRQIGYEIGATYNFSSNPIYNSTAAYSLDAVELLRNKYLHTNVTQINWNSNKENELLNLLDKGVALARGADKYAGGHAWVADAYKTMDYCEYLYRIRVPDGNLYTSDWELIKTTKLKTANFIHYNWGWDGYCNGYFLPGVFDTHNEHEYDLGMTENNSPYDFSVNPQYFFFIP